MRNQSVVGLLALTVLIITASDGGYPLAAYDGLNTRLMSLKPPAILGTPLKWGYDNAGFKPGKAMELNIIREFGFDFVVYHYHPQHNEKKNKDFIENQSSFYEMSDVQWILNFEWGNNRSGFIDSNGYDWLNHPDGGRYCMIPDEMLSFMSNLSNKPNVLYDEIGHLQNRGSGFLPVENPFSLQDASSVYTTTARKIVEKYRSYGIEVYSEHVFPIQLHALADAGFTPVSKVLKENNIPAYIATALGAAIQYDRPFWLTPDLWFKEIYPGHSVEQYKSALLMAYHMGAEGIYTENLGYRGRGSGEGKGGLIKVNGGDGSYQATAWGEVAKAFRWGYAPKNPRHYSYKDLIPKVAIIKQEDACWGQSNSWLPDQLYGVKNWKSNAATEGWLEIWNLLSNGQINKNSISWHNTTVFRDEPYQVFYPLDGVVVFDEKVGYKHLAEVELIFLTGIGISAVTLNDVQARVRQGAICVSLPSLAPREIVNHTGSNGRVVDGQGQWIVSESFLSAEVRDAVKPFLPQENYIRYRFGDSEVQFRPVDGNYDQITVKVETLP